MAIFSPKKKGQVFPDHTHLLFLSIFVKKSSVFNLLILVDYSLHIDTISMEYSILYLKPLTVLKLMYICTFLNRTDTDEKPFFGVITVCQSTYC